MIRSLYHSNKTRYPKARGHDAFNTSQALPAKEALDYVIKNVGASQMRDAVDAMLIKELLSYGKDGDTNIEEYLSCLVGEGQGCSATTGLARDA